ncbi:MAG: hypothetical protein A3I06_04705 [Candidatus Lindowbacteria bacterium RIFCSPLOWO2_02_FULL_62_12]|nr:MAG: hypothetical protein A3I06_04705 [Candidatus Lindowbacteria bacterium RIFCSPLOWO2_02_FULL_62_12]
MPVMATDRPPDRIPVFVPFTGLLMSLLPILLIAAVWLRTPGDRAFMGELQIDQFYYAANARAMLRDGFHLSHANPYDPHADAPRIYSHLFPLLVAAAARLTGCEPLHTYYFLRPILGILLALSLWYFLSALFSDRACLKLCFLLVVTAGGFSALLSAASAAGTVLRAPGADFIASFGAAFVRSEEFIGEWLCSIARVFLFTPEILYHTIWFYTLGSYLRGNSMAVLGGIALELYAHPFTGPELALVVALLCVTDLILGVNRRARAVTLVLVCALTAAFAGYIHFLNGDPCHRIIQATWRRFQAILPIDRYAHLYGAWLILGLAGLATSLRDFRTSAGARCLWTQGVVIFLLSHHQWLVPEAVQPAHFSRGYLFVVLVSLSVDFIRRFRPTWPAAICSRRGLLAVSLLALSIDHPSYFVFCAVRAQDPPMTLQKEEARLLDRLGDLKTREFVASDGNVGPLIPVFTDHRTLLGHWPLTPGYDRAESLLNLWVQSGRPDLLREYPDISILFLPRHAAEPVGRDPAFARDWALLDETPNFVLYRRQ